MMENNKFTGTWKLISYQIENSKKKYYPLGKDALGLLMYDVRGNMSVQLIDRHCPPFEGGLRLKGTVDEMTDAFKKSFSYFGTYEVDEQKGIITHLLVGCSFPNYKGSRQERHYTFCRNELTLIGKAHLYGDLQKYRLTWERIA